MVVTHTSTLHRGSTVANKQVRKSNNYEKETLMILLNDVLPSTSAISYQSRNRWHSVRAFRINPAKTGVTGLSYLQERIHRAQRQSVVIWSQLSLTIDRNWPVLVQLISSAPLLQFATLSHLWYRCTQVPSPQSNWLKPQEAAVVHKHNSLSTVYRRLGYKINSFMAEVSSIILIRNNSER